MTWARVKGVIVRRKYWFAGAAAILALLATAPVLIAPPKIPQAVIDTSVVRSPDLLEKAWHLPVARTFARDVAWQSNPSVCGPASLANTFRSLGEGARTEGDVLGGTGRCWLFGICIGGLTLDELAEVARRKTQRKVTVLRDLTAAQFRDHLRHANDPGRRYLINFTRTKIFGAGVGHHSPIAGYLEEEDLIFVLDVNRDFQPWLIERDRLFAAMDTLDGDKKRGMLLIE